MRLFPRSSPATCVLSPSTRKVEGSKLSVPFVPLVCYRLPFYSSGLWALVPSSSKITWLPAGVCVVFKFSSAMVTSIYFLKRNVRPPDVVLLVRGAVGFLFVLSSLLKLRGLFSGVRYSRWGTVGG